MLNDKFIFGKEKRGKKRRYVGTVGNRSYQPTYLVPANHEQIVILIIKIKCYLAAKYTRVLTYLLLIKDKLGHLLYW